MSLLPPADGKVIKNGLLLKYLGLHGSFESFALSNLKSGTTPGYSTWFCIRALLTM